MRSFINEHVKHSVSSSYVPLTDIICKHIYFNNGFIETRMIEANTIQALCIYQLLQFSAKSFPFILTLRNDVLHDIKSLS